MTYLTINQAVQTIIDFRVTHGLRKNVNSALNIRPDIIKSELTIDIHNDKEYDKQGITFPLLSIDFAYYVLSIVTKKSIEQYRADIDELLLTNNTDVKKDLFLTAYLTPEYL